jgi:hypothetical protein
LGRHGVHSDRLGGRQGVVEVIARGVGLVTHEQFRDTPHDLARDRVHVGVGRGFDGAKPDTIVVVLRQPAVATWSSR